MKTIAAVLLAVTLLFVLGAGNSSSGSGLRGTVLLDPGYPVCEAGTSCTRPAADAQLKFWRNGHVVARTRTDGKGRFRIALSARRYRVTTATKGLLTPVRVTVPTGRYRSVTFRLDIGIR